MLRVRWLGRVPYREALSLQEGLFTHGRGQHLLLLEHPHVYTLGRNASGEDVLASPEWLVARGVEIAECDRGGVAWRQPEVVPLATRAPFDCAQGRP